MRRTLPSKLLQAFGNLHRFRKEYGFNTWLYRIAINHSLDYRRKKRLATTPLSSFAEDTGEFFTLGNDQTATPQP
jgi:RNA polymerase sigma-70 factor (ECF subfamily)